MYVVFRQEISDMEVVPLRETELYCVLRGDGSDYCCAVNEYCVPSDDGEREFGGLEGRDGVAEAGDSSGGEFVPRRTRKTAHTDENDHICCDVPR